MEKEKKKGVDLNEFQTVPIDEKCKKDKTHMKKQLSQFCMNDNCSNKHKLECPTCMMNNHPQHKGAELDDFLHNLKQKLQQFNSGNVNNNGTQKIRTEIKEIKIILKEQIEVLKKCVDNLETVENLFLVM